MNKSFVFILACALLFMASGASAQVLYPESDFETYYRILEIKNPKIQNRLNIHPGIVNSYDKDSLDWDLWPEMTESNVNNAILPVNFTSVFNSAYPRGYNDGGLWKGKGLTSSIQGGIKGEIGLIRYSIAPILFYSQNASYGLAPPSGNADPLNYQFANGRVDYVQRYGEDAFVRLDPGQSEVRLVHKKLTIGVSTANMVFGPAQVNPIIMSNNASGIPRIDLGTDEPLQTKIGKVEAKIYWGLLRESKYYDEDDSNDNRYWSAMSIGYQPSFLENLTLGFNRAFYKRADEFNTSDPWITLFRYKNPSSVEGQNDEFDQIGSFTMRWLFKEVGFEGYMEFGRNDFGAGLTGNEPEHSRAYVIGFSKYVDVKNDGIIKLTYEHGSLDLAKSTLYRGHNTWYTHNIVRHGYTQDGQIIGAGIGPGSKSDYFEGQYFFKTGRLQLVAHRIRFNDDYFIDNVRDKERHDHEWFMSTQLTKFKGNYSFSASLGVGIRWATYYVEGDDQENIQASIRINRFF